MGQGGKYALIRNNFTINYLKNLSSVLCNDNMNMNLVGSVLLKCCLAFWIGELAERMVFALR